MYSPTKFALSSGPASDEDITMRVFVKVCFGSTATEPKTYALSCDPTASVRSLKSQALDRWFENSSEKLARNADRFRLKLTGTGADLSDKDTIQDVLREGEFVNLCE